MILLFFSGSGAPPVVEAEVVFTGSGTLTATAKTTDYGVVAFTGTGTLTASASAPETQARVAFSARATFSVAARPRGVTSPDGVEVFHRRTVIVEPDGTSIAELENAVQGDITWELNRWEEGSISLGATDPKAEAILAEKIREVQLWRGDQLLMWGPMTRPTANKNTVSTPVKGALWYLSRRYVGEANRRNYLDNPRFDDGLAGWTTLMNKWFLDFQPSGASIGVQSIVGGVLPKAPATRMIGSMSGYDDNAEGSVAAFQEFEVEGGQRGRTATFTMWYFIHSSSFLKPPALQRGILLARLPEDYRTNNFFTRNGLPNTWGGMRGGYTDTIEVSSARVDEKFPKDLWVRLECSITVPAGRTEIVHAQIEFPSFIGLATLGSLTFDDALELFDADQADIVAALVEHAQDPAFGKSDVNLTPDTTPTGVRRDYVGLFQEHPQVWQEIEEFTDLEDGFDISCSYTPTSRVVHTHYPQQGIERPNLAIDLTKNLENFDWTFDGENAANAIVFLGNGDGSDREEAAAVQEGAFAGDLILEAVVSAPANTATETLQELANERLAVAVFPETLKVSMRDASFLGRCACGDYLPVRIRRGGVTVVDQYRIIRITLTTDDHLDLTLNRRDR